MKIEIIKEVTTDLISTLSCLMSVLTGREENVSKESILEIVDSENSFLIAATDDSGKILGTLTIIIYTIPTRKKAFIEDVVVDPTAQGLGLGRKLMEAAIEVAKEKNVSRVELSSRPVREAANALYQNLGFVVRDTNYYQLVLTD